MEDFSQSRGDDDLFDDEVVPYESSAAVEQVTTQVQQVSLEPAPVAPRNHVSEDASSRSSRGRGRGNMPRGGQRSGLMSSRFATPQPQPDPKPAPSTEAATPSTDPIQPTATSAITAGDEKLSKPALNTTPTSPSTAPKPPAVRGDRTNTGGIKKPKLTEDELNAKLAAAKERSLTRSAAHARAQADAASFEQRERVAQEKRAKDAVNRRVMDGEREKNRARKMAVIGGREWDAEKREEDFRVPAAGAGPGRGRGRGRMEKDARFDDLSQYEWHEDRGRGRGGRGWRGGRGGRGAGRSGVDERQPDLNAEADFPALPVSAKTKDEKPPAKSKDERPAPARPPSVRTESDALSPSGEKGTWADQVESEVARA